MKVYLVGGAVREALLGLPIKERDWVVVGGTPDTLLSQGYTQVGRDFPVFLHPKTREEYALARTERKSAPGYYGFTCDFNPDVTLEEDLARRDLTINAMAMDKDGVLIDPFHGLDALQAKQFRHVSDAFVEDPVRVLRVARFAARYHNLGFTTAEETRCLMTEMVRRGELSHLVPERVWQEFCRSLQEKNPEQFLMTLRSCGALRVVIPELDALYGIPNDVSSGLIDSGVRSVDALKKISNVSTDPKLRFAVLVYDVGHADVPKALWPDTSPSVIERVLRIESLCSRLRIPKEYCHLATLLAKFYVQIQRLPDLEAKEIVHVLEASDAFRRHHLFEQLLVMSDALAAQSHTGQWKMIRDECAKIKVQSLISQGYEGEGIKKELFQRRVHCVEVLMR